MLCVLLQEETIFELQVLKEEFSNFQSLSGAGLSPLGAVAAVGRKGLMETSPQELGWAPLSVILSAGIWDWKQRSKLRIQTSLFNCCTNYCFHGLLFAQTKAQYFSRT